MGLYDGNDFSFITASLRIYTYATDGYLFGSILLGLR